MKMVLPVDGYRSAKEFMVAMQGSEGATHWLMKQAEHWHGGIHLCDGFAGNAVFKSGSHGLKCMTDGHVVAWRLNDDYQSVALGIKMLKFSSTFVLIKSTCTPDKGKPDNALDFYTLWMQIAPLSEYGITDKLVKRQGDVLPAWMQVARQHGVFNQVVTVSGEDAPTVKAGEIIGHLSLYERPYGGPQHFCHLEVFSQDSRMKDFLANKAGVTTGAAELHTLADKTRWQYREKDNTFVVAGVGGDPSPTTTELHTPESESRRLDTDGKTWYYIPGELAWMAAEDVERVNQFDLEKRGFMPLEQEEAPQSIFQTPKESWLRQVYKQLESQARSETRDMYSASYTEKYQKLLKLMDLNQDGVIDAGELWRFLHNTQPHIQYQVQRFVVKHHSEWLKDGMSALWQAALDEQAKKYPDMARYNRDFINKLVWMKDVPEIRSSEALWHMHPVVFLDAIAVKLGRITLNMLRKIWTSKNYVSDSVLQEVADELNANLDLCHLNTEERLYHFMAQVYQETGPKFSITESLDYPSSRLPHLFSYYRSHQEEQSLDGRTAEHKANQVNIANKAYGGRNGNNKPNDGWDYRGRGMKQLTGRYNYRAFTKYSAKKWGETIDFEEQPGLVSSSIKQAVRSALFFWDGHELYKKADGGITRAASEAITNVVNQGTDSRVLRYNNLIKFSHEKIFDNIFK